MPVHAVSGARASSAKANPCASSPAGPASGVGCLHAAKHRFQVARAHRLFGQSLKDGRTNNYADFAAEERVEGKVAAGLVMHLALDLFVECFAEARAIQEGIGQPPLLRLIVKRHDQIGNRVRRRNLGRAERHVLACAATGAARPKDGTSMPSPKSTTRATRPAVAAHITCGELERRQRVRGMETPLSLSCSIGTRGLQLFS